MAHSLKGLFYEIAHIFLNYFSQKNLNLRALYKVDKIKFRVLLIFLVSVFGQIGLSYGYELSIQKYDLKDGKNYCYELYEQVYRRPYTYDNPNTLLIPAKAICLVGEGPNLLRDLYSIEFQNRYFYKSHSLTLKLLSKANLVFSAHKLFLQKFKEHKQSCEKKFVNDCRLYPYLANKEAKLLKADYEMVMDEIFQVTMSCVPGEIGSIGCQLAVIPDPYLPQAIIATIITPEDMDKLKVIYETLKRGRKGYETL